MCDIFCKYFIDNPRNIHEPIAISTSHHLDQREINERSMHFRNATETVLIMRLNKESGINDVCRKLLLICKIYVSFYPKELLSFSFILDVYPNVFEFAQLTPIYIKKALFITYQFTGQCLY